MSDEQPIRYEQPAPKVARIWLDEGARLDRDAVAAFVSHATGGVETPGFVTRLHELTGGTPFFAFERVLRKAFLRAALREDGLEVIFVSSSGPSRRRGSPGGPEAP